jgi:hypothetical protein
MEKIREIRGSVFHHEMHEICPKSTKYRFLFLFFGSFSGFSWSGLFSAYERRTYDTISSEQEPLA